VEKRKAAILVTNILYYICILMFQLYYYTNIFVLMYNVLDVARPGGDGDGSKRESAREKEP
jgi:hypothetical protein